MCVPSFILKLVQYAEAHQIDYRNSSIRRIIASEKGCASRISVSTF